MPNNPNIQCHLPGPVCTGKYADIIAKHPDSEIWEQMTKAFQSLVPGPLGLTSARGADSTQKRFGLGLRATPSELNWWASHPTGYQRIAKGYQRISFEEKNIRAFLKLIRVAETRIEDDSAYTVMYGGKTFHNFSTHPYEQGLMHEQEHPHAHGKKHTKKKAHTPAGAYQIIIDTYRRLKNMGIVNDFSPHSQDLIARFLIGEYKALVYVEMGKIHEAIHLLNKQWAALPGNAQSHMLLIEADYLFRSYVAEQLFA